MSETEFKVGDRVTALAGGNWAYGTVKAPPDADEYALVIIDGNGPIGRREWACPRHCMRPLVETTSGSRLRTPCACKRHGPYEGQPAEGIYRATCPKCHADENGMVTINIGKIEVDDVERGRRVALTKIGPGIYAAPNCAEPGCIVPPGHDGMHIDKDGNGWKQVTDGVGNRIGTTVPRPIAEPPTRPLRDEFGKEETYQQRANRLADELGLRDSYEAHVRRERDAVFAENTRLRRRVEMLEKMLPVRKR